MKIKISVKPNSKKQEYIDDKERGIIIHLKSPAQDNKANIELVKFLRKKFKKEVKIISGLTSKRKIIELI